MPILSIRHVTTYYYRQPVAFGEHRMMLRPRDDSDQKVLESSLDIAPEPSELAWTQDCFGNHVAIARFARAARELRFESTMFVDHAPARFRAADIADYARIYPFDYAAHEKAGLARFMAPPPRTPSSIAGRRAFCARTDRPKPRAARRHDADDQADLPARARHQKGTQDRSDSDARERELPRCCGVHDRRRCARLASLRGSCPDICILPRPMTTVSPAATPMPGSRPMFRAPAGSISIRRAARSETRISCASRSCTSRARRSRCKVRGSGARRTIWP